MKFEIKETPTMGKGLFAAARIEKGEQILEFVGEIVTYEEYLLNPPPTHSGNPLQIGLTEYLDLQPTDPGVFANHSCSPNAGIKNDRFLVALETILPNQEIFYDYSTTMHDDSWTMECKCGSPNCRQIVKDFIWLPKDVQQHYLKLGVVQHFIQKLFAE